MKILEKIKKLFRKNENKKMLKESNDNQKEEKKAQKTPSSISALYPSFHHLPNHIAAVLQTASPPPQRRAGWGQLHRRGVSLLTQGA